MKTEEGKTMTLTRDKLMTLEWQYKSVQHDSCTRDANGNVTCQLGSNQNGF